MRVFVAGGSGVIGRSLVPKLVSAGHEVTGMTRSEARNLLDAAGAAGARRFVAQSVAFGYRPDGGRVKTEEDGLLGDAAGGFGSAMKALRTMEEMVLGDERVEGLVLRYGFFYGPGTYYGEGGAYVDDVRRRRMPVVGRGTGLFSFIHVDDAADATVAAVEHGTRGIYNVTDNEPAAMSDWVPALAEAAEAPRPLRVPAWVARLAAGKQAVGFALEMRAASNEKAKRELGWTPAHPTWRTGFAESLR